MKKFRVEQGQHFFVNDSKKKLSAIFMNLNIRDKIEPGLQISIHEKKGKRKKILFRK